MLNNCQIADERVASDGQSRGLSSVHRLGWRFTSEDRRNLRIVIPEAAVTELARELDMATLLQQVLGFGHAEHPHDMGKVFRRTATIVYDRNV